MTQLAEHDRIRDSIRATIQRQGSRLKHATPATIIATMVAAACMPVVWPLLGVPEPLKAAVDLLGVPAGGFITDFVKEAIGRLRDQDGPKSKSAVQEALERELLACLHANDEHAAALRADAAVLLERVQGVQAALEAAAGDVQQALVQAFSALGATLGEFRWMLDQTRHALAAIQQDQARLSAEQHHQTDLARETLIKTNLALQQLDAIRRVVIASPTPPVTSAPIDEARIAAVSPLDAGPCPYKGLERFEAKDAEWFYGRTRLVAKLIARLSETPFLAVLGPSGSGKSSVLHAGLLPAVWSGLVPGADAWQTITFTPGAHPLEELASRVALLRRIASGSLLADLTTAPSRICLAVRQALLDRPANARVLLVIDQFEEAFTLCHDSGERRCFIQALAALAGDPDSRASVVLGVRADFYARCSEQPDLVALLQDNQVLVGPMTAAELRQAIEGPAERAGLTLEAGLATTILGDLGEEPGSLPLLSHALFATWQHRQDHTLTLAGYQATGGVRQAIAKTAETVYQALTSAEQAVAKGVFLRLTALGEGTEDTRRRVRRAELLTGQDADLVAVVLDRLATARLISLDEDNVDVAHEALIREWPTLRRWLADDREGLRTHRQLTESAIEWERLGRDADALYRGARLARASDWAHHNQPRLNRLEQEFLVASRAQERSEIEVARRRNRRLRVLAGSLAALLVLVSVTSVFAIQQRRTAVQQRQAAVRQRDSAQLQGDIASSRELAAEAEAKSISDPQLAALLSLAAFKLNDTVEARVGLLHQVERLHDARRFLTGHTDVVNDVAFSPDGRTLASSSDDGKVILWDMTRHARLATLTGYGVAFSPDGRTLASTSDNGKLLLWDVVRRARLATLTAFTSEYHRVLSVAFSPDGRTLASYTSDDDKIVLWDVARRVRRAILPGPGADGPGGMAFSPDGRILVSGDGHAVDFWDVARRTRVASVPGDTTIVAGVAFSPDGRTVASGSDNGKVILWDASRHTRLATMTAGASKFGMVAFSPDGHTLAAGTEGADGQIVLWDVARRARMATLTAYSGNGTEATASVAFSPDGRTLASGGDNNVTLWNAHPQPALGAAPTTLVVDLRNLPSDLRDLHGAAFSPDRQGFTVVAVNDRGELVLWDVVRRVRLATLPGDTGEVTIAFSPDGHVLAAAEDGKLVLWDVARRTRLATLKTGVYGDVVFSPNGRLLTIVSGRASITLWDVARHTQMATLTGHTGTVRDVAFSPDGRTLASASEDNSIIVWDVARRTRLATLTGHTDSVGTVAFSPDGRTLASGSVDRKLILWDVARRTRLATATAHAEQVLGVAFSPDGRMLASVSEEGRTILWDVTRRSQPTSMATLAGFVVAPSPDGRTLAGVTDDGKLLFWDVDVASWQRRLCAIVGRDLTRDEWATYLPGRLYQHTCD